MWLQWPHAYEHEFKKYSNHRRKFQPPNYIFFLLKTFEAYKLNLLKYCREEINNKYDHPKMGNFSLNTFLIPMLKA